MLIKFMKILLVLKVNVLSELQNQKVQCTMCHVLNGPDGSKTAICFQFLFLFLLLFLLGQKDHVGS